MKNFLLLTLGAFLFTSGLLAEGNQKKGSNSLAKSNGQPLETKFNINNISTYFSTNGDSDHDPTGHSGFVFPKVSGKAVFYESGFIWGAKVDDQIRVGGSTYNHGLLGGRILNSGLPVNQLVAEDSITDNVRIYRVRRDYKTGNLIQEASEENTTVEAVYVQYEKDWDEWPAADGAPFNDTDSNGVYDPQIDIPGFPGADQTIWFVSNDLNTFSTHNLYGSPPMGIEIQTTIWGYNQAGPLNNMLFRKYLWINKSNKNFNDMYVAMWSDPDIGDAKDDFIGCDTTLSLGYCYNGNSADQIYGTDVPACGFDFFQGPVVAGKTEDTAILKNKIIKGYTNLPMTAFFYFINSDDVYSDPALGDYQGSIEMYNLMQGKIGTTGDYFPIPEQLGGGETTFPLSGDPVTGTGYVDGILFEPEDRRFGISSGPFNMTSGDTQEVVVAQIAALGYNNLSSVTLLKNYAGVARQLYDENFPKISLPKAPEITADDSGEGITLNWETISAETENFSQNGYEFQGYNVYQIDPSLGTEESQIRIATFDIIDGITTIIDDEYDPKTGTNHKVTKQFGNDTGISREITINKDFLTSSKLLKGKNYYFAVTAYTYCGSCSPNNTETGLDIIKVGYHKTIEGPYYGEIVPYKFYGDSVDLDFEVIVYDADSVNKDQFKISFTVNGDDCLWNLSNYTTGKTILSAQPLDNLNRNYPVVNGFKISKLVCNLGIAGEGDGMVEIKYAGQNVEPDSRGENYGGNKVWYSLNSTNEYVITGGSNNRNNENDMNDLYQWVKFTAKRDFELRFTEKGGFGVYNFIDNKIAHVPFELWNIGQNTEDNSDDIRMIPFLNSVNTSKDEWDFSETLSDQIYWGDPEGIDGYEKFAAVCEASGGPGKIYDFQLDNSTNSFWADFHDSSAYPWSKMTFWDYVGKQTPPPAGTTIRIITKKLPKDGDYLIFSLGSVVSVKDIAKEISFNLSQNYPNPFNPTTTISYSLKKTSDVKIDIFDILGRKVSTLVNEEKPAGNYNVNFDASQLSSGVYIYRIQAGEFIQSKKMMLLK